LIRSPPKGSGAEGIVAKLLAGRHSCRTQIETLDHISGLNEHVVGGATGTLTLAQDGARVTAQYSGDTSLAGTLRFKAKTSTTPAPRPARP
jgi:hypothetical protein